MKILFLLLTIAISSICYSQELTGEQIFEKVNNSVLMLKGSDFLDYENISGSGVVINVGEKYVLTNFHVFKECKSIKVSHYDKYYDSIGVVYANPEKDLLILKVYNLDLEPIKIADVSNIKAGQKIYTIGSPLGNENLIYTGMINRMFTDSTNLNSMVQIDAYIDRGSSGGALVNSKGELIGITTKGNVNKLINFAINIKEFIKVIEKNNFNKGEFYINALVYFNLNAINKRFLDLADSSLYNIITTYPDYSRKYDIYKLFGRIYYYLNEYDKAIAFFNKGLETCNEDCSELYIWKANMLVYKSQVDDAINNLKLALKETIDDYNALNNLAAMYFFKSEKSGYQKEYLDTIYIYTKKALKIFPESLPANQTLAAYYSWKEDYKNAEKTLLKIINLGYEVAVIWGDLGSVYMNLGDIESSNKCYVRCANLGNKFCQNKCDSLGLKYNR